MAKSKEIKDSIEKSKLKSDELEKEVNAKLNLIGNIVGPDVPIFKDEDNNAVHRTWGKVPDLKIDGKTLGKLEHHKIMHLLDMVDLERGAKIAKHRGYFLKGIGVMLNQALINFGISTLHGNGYTPIQPPYFMKSSIMH